MEKIAVLGPEGTFSDSAARQYADASSKESEIVYYPTIDHVVHAVDINECNVGIVPIENTLDGYVQRTLDMLLESEVKICREITIPVKFSLLLKGNDISDLKRLYVQFKASGQCRHYIDTFKSLEVVTTQSNMESYEKIKDFGDAAVVPYHIALNENKLFKVCDITDSDNNVTRFAVISKQNIEQGEKNTKIPLYIMPQTDRPGLLSDALKIFAEHNINLASIMSRPQRTTLGHYNFYLELEVPKDDEKQIALALSELAKDFSYKILSV